jgi:hypothetical protein
MAGHLLKQKYRVIVYDKNTDAVDRLCKQGAQRAGSPAELASTPGKAGQSGAHPGSVHRKMKYQVCIIYQFDQVWWLLWHVSGYGSQRTGL